MKTEALDTTPSVYNDRIFDPAGAYEHLRSFVAISGDRKVCVDCVGSGSPAAIFVHGGGCDRHDWRAQVRALAPTNRAVAVDLPGHGESSAEGGKSVEELASCVSEILTKYAPEQAVLVGHSMGCRVVLEAFRQSPERVAGLVFVDGSTYAQSGDEQAAAAAIAIVDRIGFIPFIEGSFREMFLDDSAPELVQRLVDRAKRWDSDTAKAALFSAINWDVHEAPQVLAMVEVPVLLLQSSYVGQDFKRQSLAEGMSTTWTELVQAQAPQAVLKIITGVGHFPHIEAFDKVNAEILSFIATLRMPSDPQI